MSGAYQLIERGNQELQNGNYQVAIEDYNEAVRLNPNQVAAYFNRGVCKHNIQDYKGAIEDFSKSIRLNSNDADAYCKRGNSKKNIQDYKGAIEDYSLAIRFDPENAEAYYNRGFSKDQLGEDREAIKDYNQFIRLYPDYATAYYNLGISKNKIGDLYGAIEDFSQAIRLKPDYADAYSNRGISKSRLQDYKGAIEDCTQAIRLNPDYSYAFNNRGNNKDSIQDHRGAIQDYSQAIRLNPNYVEAYFNRGISKSYLKDYQGAIQDYSQAIRLNPGDSTSYYNRGINKKNIQDYYGAIEDYDEAIRLNPYFDGAFYSRGFSKSNIQDHKGAVEDYNEAIRLNPGYVDAFYNRGISKNRLQDLQGAVQDYNEAIRLDPNDADAYYNRGINKHDLKDYKGAIQDYNETIRLNPGYVTAYHNRGINKKIMQDYRGAQSDYLQALSLSPQPSPLHLFNLAILYLEMGFNDEALKRYNQGIKVFRTETQANLKKKFKLSQQNINHIKNQIDNFEKISREVEEIRLVAQQQGRNDIGQEIIKIRASIVNAYIKSTDEKADQQKVLSQMKAMRDQIDHLQMQLRIVKKKVSKLEAKVEQMEKRIYTEDRTNNMIEKIDSRKLSEFYKLLYNMLINHFMAYRMLSTGFFNESVREVTTFDNVVGKVCSAQSIIQSIPVLGDLVGIPFKILHAFREEKSSRLNSVISDKINGSRLHSEAIITHYISHLIEALVNNDSFNTRLKKAIKTEQKSLLNQVMDVFGQLKEKIYSKVFGGSSGEVSYVQQVVTLYVTRFTLQLYEVDSEQFSRHCKSEETFSAFFMECFEEKAKKQPKIRDNKQEQPFDDSLKQPWIAKKFEVEEEEEESQQESCCQSFFRQICCCLTFNPKSSSS